MIEHFEVVQIKLPYVSGACTLPDSDPVMEGFHTPLTCVESTNGEFTYNFARKYTPVGVQVEGAKHPLHRCIKSVSETTAQLKPKDGMASRPSMSVTFDDFKGDPCYENPTETGFFFAKMVARNVMTNRKVVLIRYKKEDGVVSEVSRAVYVMSAFDSKGNYQWQMSCKSILDKTYEDSAQYPPPTNAFIRTDVSETATTIPVMRSGEDGFYPFKSGEIIRVGDEFMKVTGANHSGGTISVATRGSKIVGASGGKDLTVTVKESHSAGDDIQVCKVADNSLISDVLVDALTEAGIPSSYINKATWDSELASFWSTARINNLYSEPEPCVDVINRICTDFMLDFWEDNQAEQLRLSAISQWKETEIYLKQGQGITADTMKVKFEAEDRASRVFVYHGAPNKAEDDFRKLSYAADATLESTDYYSEKKEVDLGESSDLSLSTANIKVARYLARFKNPPNTFTWDIEEKYLNYELGQIVSFKDETRVDYFGNPATNRGQITRVTPQYSKIGRYYKVECVDYANAFGVGGGGDGGDPDDPRYSFTATIKDSYTDTTIDLFSTYVGVSDKPVDLTLILDNCTIGSQPNSVSIDANSAGVGGFPAGSTIKIILKNGTQWSAHGGRNYNYAWDASSSSYVRSGSRYNGATCYQSRGVQTAVHTSGIIDGHTANGYFFAAGGAGEYGGMRQNQSDPIAPGGGGSGIPGGAASTLDSPVVFFTKVSTSGTYNAGGSWSHVQNVLVADFHWFGGVGGTSANGGNGRLEYRGTGSPLYSYVVMSQETQAGYAHKGGSVTISGDTSWNRYRPGRS